jgi:hypothetical protein
MSWIQAIAKSAGAKAALAAVVVLSLSLAIYIAMGFLRGNGLDDGRYSIYMCTETGKAFKHKNEEGEVPPVYSPYSGKNTGVKAELCYWTADGGTKKDPTPVLLNRLAGKDGPTFCPDCGRLVVGHNPAPRPGAKPPPTRAEYEANTTP